MPASLSHLINLATLLVALAVVEVAMLYCASRAIVFGRAWRVRLAWLFATPMLLAAFVILAAVFVQVMLG